MPQTIHHEVVVIGGGTAGISVAARLARRWFDRPEVAIIEPSERHFYQPLWTLVGGGVARKESTVRSEASVIPRHATWIRDAVRTIDPLGRVVETRDGCRVTYDWLVVAAGLEIHWDQVTGLKDAVGHDGVCSNYSFDTVDSTWEAIRNFRGGTALFTNPSGAVKCGGAPQKIMYLADDWFRRAGVRGQSRVIFASAQPNIFAVQPYRSSLERVIARKQIDCRFRHELVEVRAAEKRAVFRRLDDGDQVVLDYDLLHVTPPMGPPRFLAQSPLADAEGWIDVDPGTLRHARYPEVFALGDSSNLPTSKTAAAIRKQAPVVARNLLAARRGQPMPAIYDGYTSCPLVTGYGKLILAEFDYQKQPRETFPVDQSQERWSMWLLKRYLLPALYWHGMLKGRA